MNVDNAMQKIPLEPLDFEEFNLIDILINQEISETAFQMRLAPSDRSERLLARLRAIRAKVDRARPKGYVDAIRAARAATVCDT